jgi:Spy/CpxP family protein refolding chaperone
MSVYSLARRTFGVVSPAVVMLVLFTSVPASAQSKPQGRGPAAQAESVSPGEIHRLFDAYVAMQAQQELQLSDDQYPKFLTKVKTLQAARQRGLVDRRRLIQDLRELNDGPSLDEAQARAQLKALADLDARTIVEVRDALAGLDQVLDLRQQVRFRIFEEQMERRKVDLLMRARQANRQRNQP